MNIEFASHFNSRCEAENVPFRNDIEFLSLIARRGLTLERPNPKTKTSHFIRTLPNLFP